MRRYPTNQTLQIAAIVLHALERRDTHADTSGSKEPTTDPRGEAEIVIETDESVQCVPPTRYDARPTVGKSREERMRDEHLRALERLRKWRAAEPQDPEIVFWKRNDP